MIATLRDISKRMSDGYILYSNGRICWLIDLPAPRGQGTRTALQVDCGLFNSLVRDGVFGALRDRRDPASGYYKIGWADMGLSQPPIGWGYFLFVQ